MRDIADREQRFFTPYPNQARAPALLSDALRDLAPRVREHVTSTEHTVTEDKVTGEVVETLTVRWKRREDPA